MNTQPVPILQLCATPPSDAGATPNEVATPRTDKVLFVYKVYERQDGREYVSADFARTLEHELAERDREIARLKTPEVLHAHCLRYMTEAQIAHLFGERMTAIVNEHAATLAKLTAAEQQIAARQIERDALMHTTIKYQSEQQELRQQIAELTRELAPLRELVGVDARAQSSLSDIQHWQKLMNAWDENVKLRSDLTAARRDGERIDWMSNLICREYALTFRRNSEHSTTLFAGGPEVGRGIGIRAAIDAALTANPQP